MDTTWTDLLLLLSPFVLVPLGLRLIAHSDLGPAAPRLSALGVMAPAFAMFAAASHLFDHGLLAAVLAVPWLCFTVAAAITAYTRLLSRRTATPAVGADIGLVFLAVGAVWMVISRAGWNPLGFSDDIVRLTAVHFHYAGFALPIVASFAAVHLGRSPLIPVVATVSVPLTAIGITVGGWLEWGAATIMALAGLAVAGLLRQLSTRVSGLASWLLGTSSVSLFAGMCLAIGWAWSVRFGWNFLGIEQMAATHGSLNALGFGLLGLIGLTVARQQLNDTDTSISDRVLLEVGRASRAPLDALAADAKRHGCTGAPLPEGHDLPRGYTTATFTQTIPSGSFDQAADAIRTWTGHKAAQIAVAPANAPITVGQDVAVAIPIGPLVATAACRIIEVIDEPDRFGFTYASLPHHPIEGTETFTVNRHPDGAIEAKVSVTARPAILATRICPPITRFLQARMINRYLAGLLSAAEAASPRPLVATR